MTSHKSHYQRSHDKLFKSTSVNKKSILFYSFLPTIHLLISMQWRSPDISLTNIIQSSLSVIRRFKK